MSAVRPREIFRAGAVVVLCLLPLLWKAGVPDSTFHMEVMSLMPSQETWLRCHAGEARAWVLPSWNGRPRLNKPPMLVWLNLLAWHGLDPDNAAVDELVRRARVLSAALAGLGLVGVYAMGQLLGGSALAWRAVLATGTMLFFIRQCRLASYDTHLFAWVSVAVALIWWALKSAWLAQGRPQGAAWAAAFLAGAALGMGVLTKGPIAFLFVLVPAGTILWALGPPRKPCARLVLLMLLAAVALSSPWYGYLLHEFPAAGQVLLSEYRQAREKAQFPLYYFVLLALAFPWSFSLAGACGVFLCRQSRKSLSRREWIPLVWLLAVLVLMSVPEAKRERYVFPVFPAAGLLVAQWWLWLEERGRSPGALAGWERALFWGHGAALVGCSAAIASFPAIQALLLKMGFLTEAVMPGLEWKASLPAGFVLLCLTAWALKLVQRGRYGRTLALSAVWMALVSTFVLHYYVHSHHGHYPGRMDAERAASLSRGIALFWLCTDPGTDREPDQKFLLYSRRIIPRIGPEELKRVMGWRGKIAVIGKADEAHGRIASQLGLEPVLAFKDGRQERVLYMRRDPQPKESAP